MNVFKIETTVTSDFRRSLGPMMTEQLLHLASHVRVHFKHMSNLCAGQ